MDSNLLISMVEIIITGFLTRVRRTSHDAYRCAPDSNQPGCWHCKDVTHWDTVSVWQDMAAAQKIRDQEPKPTGDTYPGCQVTQVITDPDLRIPAESPFFRTARCHDVCVWFMLGDAHGFSATVGRSTAAPELNWTSWRCVSFKHKQLVTGRDEPLPMGGCWWRYHLGSIW